ncbi:MAG: arginine repressor [Actinomycetes bacterium]|jgi:transcriptional regulator of arginine metabolism
MTNRASRLALIQEIISGNNVSSQAEIVLQLARKGVSVTQATLSRDLEILGAVKIVKGSAGLCYAIPDDGTGTPITRDASRLARAMSELAASVDYSANIVVVRTSPGAASYLASTIDRSGLNSIIGTVAGDDTVMLITRDPVGGASVCQELQDLART